MTSLTGFALEKAVAILAEIIAAHDDNHAHSMTSVLDEYRLSQYNSMHVELFTYPSH